MIDLLKREPAPWIYCVASGAGAGMQNQLWETPGASRYLAGASFPYASYETERFLGYTPKSYCSADEALELAMEAYCRSCESLSPGQEPIGLAITASVASVREHRGDHRLHGAVVTSTSAYRATLALVKGTGTARRIKDGELADGLGLGLLRIALWGPVWQDAFPVDRVSDQTLRALFLEHPFFDWGVRRHQDLTLPPADVVLLPGAFNPIHQGHREMAIAVSKKTGKPVVYMISGDSPHKPRMTAQEMLARVAMFRRERLRNAIGEAVLFGHQDPLYIDKARRYPGASFAIGADAMIRMLDPSWGPEIAPMLREFGELGTTFYVFGRQIEDRYVGPADVVAQIARVAPGTAPTLVSSSGAWITLTPGFSFYAMGEVLPIISSTQIREESKK
jgi:cytidylyltransferase-like protein